MRRESGRIETAPVRSPDGYSGGDFLAEETKITDADRSSEDEGVELSPEQLARIENYLRDEGVISEKYIEELGKKVTVIDLDRIANDRSLSSFRAFNPVVEKDGRNYRFSKRNTLFALLEGQSGLTPEQVARKEYVEKPFLYVPESVRAATSMTGIREADFHAGIWDLNKTNNPQEEHPVVDGDSEDSITETEARCAVLIFHPKYGDALHEDGQLKMRHPKTRKYQPFSWDLLKQYGIHENTLMGNPKSPDRSSTIREAFSRRLPHLVQREVLIPEQDIREYSLLREDGQLKEQFSKTIKNPRYVMIFGVNHYLDRDGVPGTHRVEKLTDKVAVLVDPVSGRITHTFNVFSREDIVPTESGYYNAGAEKTKFRALDPQSYTLPKREFESEAQYRARVFVVDEGLQEFLQNSREVPSLAALVRGEGGEIQKDLGDGIRFVKETEGGIEALKSLAARFGKDERGIKNILSSYAGLMQAADEAESFVRDTVECADNECDALVEKVRRNMLAKAQQLLSSSVRDEDPHAVAEKLKHFEVSATLFASTFKTLKAEGGAIEWEKIRDASFEQTPAIEISQEDQDRMREIFESRYGTKDYSEKFRISLRKSFNNSFSNPNTTYYVYRHQGKIIAYSRSEVVGKTQEGLQLKHRSTLMADPAYEGGSIGLAFLERSIALDVRGSQIEAECDADPIKTPSICSYFENYGYIAVAYREDKAEDETEKEKGEPTLVLEQKDGETFRTKKLSQKEIRAYAHAHVDRDGVRFVRHDDTVPFEAYLKDGYVMTRFFVDNPKTKPVYYAAFEQRPSR